MDNVMSDLHAEFVQREQERDVVRAELNDVAQRIADAESRLLPVGVFGSEERLALARARVEVLSAIRSIDRVADERENRNIRSMHNAIERISARQAQ